MPKASATTRTEKEPGRLAQMLQVFRMTIREDRRALPILIVCFAVPVVLGVLAALLLAPGNVVGMILYIVLGVLLGFLLFLLLLGRLAERAAYARIAGQPGAVSAVVQNSLRGSWIGDAMPVAVNPKTQDAVYRVVGKGGVGLIAEGPTSRTRRLVEEQRRVVQRIIANVPITVIQVGPDPDSTPLHRIPATLRRTKSVLKKAEIRAISARFESLSRGGNLPIPKGIDPLKVRAPRPR